MKQNTTHRPSGGLSLGETGYVNFHGLQTGSQKKRRKKTCCFKQTHLKEKYLKLGELNIKVWAEVENVLEDDDVMEMLKLAGLLD